MANQRSQGLLSRWLGLDRNPLRRPSDRLQSIGLVLLIVGVIAALPIGILVGQLTEQAGTRRALERAANLTPVTAVLLEDTSEDDGETSARVEATWTAANGAVKTAEIEVPQGRKTGDVVPIWVDATGAQRTAPASAAAIQLGAMVTGVAAGLGVVMVLTSLHLLLMFGLDQRRYSRWARQWERIGPRWRY